MSTAVSASMQAALLIREKQRLRRKKRQGRGDLPSHVATKDIAPFPRYPPESWVRDITFDVEINSISYSIKRIARGSLTGAWMRINPGSCLIGIKGARIIRTFGSATCITLRIRSQLHELPSLLSFSIIPTWINTHRER